MEHLTIDTVALSRLCERFGVLRLRLFGSALTDAFDPARSDLDFIVDFVPGRPDQFADFFGLKEGLEHMFGRSIDLIVGRSIRNPYFRQEVTRKAREVYAA